MVTTTTPARCRRLARGRESGAAGPRPLCRFSHNRERACRQVGRVALEGPAPQDSWPQADARHPQRALGSAAQPRANARAMACHEGDRRPFDSP